ncbi:MAG: phosphoribosylanthranilate isomerase [Parabacteroides sp.]|nr:phosphoribosylanthranilate isomerase [Parabacteroides sp.]
MIIKVCGLCRPENIRQVAALEISWMGFIFYPPSPRFAGGLPAAALAAVPASIRKVGVFVNEEAARIRQYVQQYGLHAVQLHGDETPGFCSGVRERGVQVIKAFAVAEASDFTACARYEGHCDYFLFDTKTPLYGGSGRQFDWGTVKSYRGTVPFLLSGGIGEEDAERLATFSHPLCAGIDLNSRFEEAPGQKDVIKLGRFIDRLNTNKN